jgi:hypothetical protein
MLQEKIQKGAGHSQVRYREEYERRCAQARAGRAG